MSNLDYKVYRERNLPHYQPPGATLFVTFRLAGSLPVSVIHQFKEDLERQRKAVFSQTKPEEVAEVLYVAQKQAFGKFDGLLDSSKEGPHWLAIPDVADLVCQTIHMQDGKQFILEAYCLMPNHVHMVITPSFTGGEVIPLARILHGLKGSTAKYANELLKRKGPFWQSESYDHVVRDEQEYDRVVNYVMENPLRAGLPAKWLYRRNLDVEQASACSAKTG